MESDFRKYQNATCETGHVLEVQAGGALSLGLGLKADISQRQGSGSETGLILSHSKYDSTNRRGDLEP